MNLTFEEYSASSDLAKDLTFKTLKDVEREGHTPAVAYWAFVLSIVMMIRAKEKQENIVIANAEYAISKDIVETLKAVRSLEGENSPDFPDFKNFKN